MNLLSSHPRDLFLMLFTDSPPREAPLFLFRERRLDKPG